MTFSARPHFLLHGRVTPKVQKLYKAAVHAFGEYLARRQEQDSSFLMPLSIDALDTSLTTRYLQAGNSILLAMQAPPGLAELGLALAQDVFAALH